MSKGDRIIGEVVMAHAKERNALVTHARDVWKKHGDWP